MRARRSIGLERAWRAGDEPPGTPMAPAFDAKTCSVSLHLY